MQKLFIPVLYYTQLIIISSIIFNFKNNPTVVVMVCEEENSVTVSMGSLCTPTGSEW